MARLFPILLSAFLFVQCSTAQDCVESDTYHLMLRGLLENNVPTLCVDSAKNIKSAVFLDAREQEEAKVSTIKNALPVGYDHFELERVSNLPKDTMIVVYCSVGYRSEKITQQLIKAGYTHVFNLYGGIFEWVNQGNTVYHKDSITQKVHAYDKIWGQWLNAGDKVY